MRTTELNPPKSLWQFNSGPKLLLAFVFLFRNLFHKFFLLLPYNILAQFSSYSSNWWYTKRTSCWCCSCSHSHFSSTQAVIVCPSSSPPAWGKKKKKTAKNFAKSLFQPWSSGHILLTNSKGLQKNKAISPEYTCCQSSEAFSFASPCLLKEGLLSSKAQLNHETVSL